MGRSFVLNVYFSEEKEAGENTQKMSSFTRNQEKYT